jgi:hypothetical protein
MTSQFGSRRFGAGLCGRPPSRLIASQQAEGMRWAALRAELRPARKRFRWWFARIDTPNRNTIHEQPMVEMHRRRSAYS